MRERRYAEGKETCRGYFKADYVWLAAQVLFFSRYFIFYSTHVKSTSVPPHTHTPEEQRGGVRYNADNKSCAPSRSTVSSRVKLA